MPWFNRKKKSEAADVIESDSTTGGSSEIVPTISTRPGLPRHASSVLPRGALQKDVTARVMLSHIYDSCQRRGYMKSAKENVGMVALSIHEGETQCLPANSDNKHRIASQIFAILPRAEAATILPYDLPRLILSRVSPVANFVVLDKLQMPVLDDVSQLDSIPKSNAPQRAVLLRDSKSVLIWSNEVEDLMRYAISLEESFTKFLWNPTPLLEKKWDTVTEVKEIFSPSSSQVDLELSQTEPRRHIWLWPVMMSACLLILAAFLGAYVRHLIYESFTDKNYIRMALVLYVPFVLAFSSSLTSVIVTGVCMMVGPISHLRTNSQFYSGLRPKRDTKIDLPEIVIQCPVYKESLSQVLVPTFESAFESIKSYQAQGGVARIVVNDDALQILPREEAEQRKEYYRKHNIGWTARPGHCVDGFIRAGKFKKGSNMNFGLQLANSIEDKLDAVERVAPWTDEKEEDAYDDALAQVLEESNGIAWAEGDVRMGDLILIIDSDTRLPSDCFLDAAIEFAESPELALLQHTSGVLQVTNNFWENAWAFFTRMIYFQIKYTVAAGDQPPFFGHNAFLRFSALQEVSFMEDNQVKWWSDKHVSEDFELALKLQIHGYSLRLAAYCDDDDNFKEGVCLTVYEEIVRWEKYAYGVSEIIFNPFKQWFTRGPFTRLFRQLVWTNSISFYVKFGMMAYMSSYYAIGATWILVCINYLIEGWFQDLLDQAYINAYGVLITVLVIFPLKDGIALAYARWRRQDGGLVNCFAQNLLNMPLVTIFFSGLSMHVSWALVCHLCGIPIEWSFTAKTLDQSSFWQELPKIWQRYKYVYAWCITWLVAMLVMAFAVPAAWQIRTLFAILPLAWSIAWHLLVPFVLNPQSYLSEISS